MKRVRCKRLKAYIMYPYPGAKAALCIYHYTSRAAKKLGLYKLEYREFKEVTCVRYPLADKFGAMAPLPEIETDPAILALLGLVLL